MFDWTATSMHGINLNIACTKWQSTLMQKQWLSAVRRSLPKREAAEKVGKNLLQENCIFEARCWFFNVVLVKKSNEKLCMCVVTQSISPNGIIHKYRELT